MIFVLFFFYFSLMCICVDELDGIWKKVDKVI